jgi:hypothetical protein
MDNPISINFGGDNSISNLSFIWTAKFKNSDDICQFNFETGIENRFQLVKDNFDNLEYFILWNKEQTFTVDLLNGLIYFNKELMNKIDSIDKKENCRLIYFRRHRKEIGEIDLKEKSHTITYHLGFQYNDKNGNNRQIVLIIDKNGNWILGE